jgi:hypothetical protein
VRDDRLRRREVYQPDFDAFQGILVGVNDPAENRSGGKLLSRQVGWQQQQTQ